MSFFLEGKLKLNRIKLSYLIRFDSHHSLSAKRYRQEVIFHNNKFYTFGGAMRDGRAHSLENVFVKT